MNREEIIFWVMMFVLFLAVLGMTLWIIFCG